MESEPKIGRPTIYTHELGEKIKQMLADGMSVRKISEEDGMPDKTTILNWAMTDTHPFFIQYAHGRKLQAEGFVDMAMDLSLSADQAIRTSPEKKSGAVVQAKRLQIDTLKWIACKVIPKIYGERAMEDRGEAREERETVASMTKAQALELLAKKKEQV